MLHAEGGFLCGVLATPCAAVLGLPFLRIYQDDCVPFPTCELLSRYKQALFNNCVVALKVWPPTRRWHTRHQRCLSVRLLRACVFHRNCTHWTISLNSAGWIFWPESLSRVIG